MSCQVEVGGKADADFAHDSIAQRIVTHQPSGPGPRAGHRSLAAASICADDSGILTLQVDIPDSIAAEAREHISVDHLIANTLTAHLDKSPQPSTMAERAAHVDWAKVDHILAWVAANQSLPGDGL